MKEQDPAKISKKEQEKSTGGNGRKGGMDSE